MVGLFSGFEACQEVVLEEISDEFVCVFVCYMKVLFFVTLMFEKVNGSWNLGAMLVTYSLACFVPMVNLGNPFQASEG